MTFLNKIRNLFHVKTTNKDIPKKEQPKPDLLEIVEASPLSTLDEILHKSGKAPAALKAWITMYKRSGKLVEINYEAEASPRYVTKAWYKAHKGIRANGGTSPVHHNS